MPASLAACSGAVGQGRLEVTSAQGHGHWVPHEPCLCAELLPADLPWRAVSFRAIGYPWDIPGIHGEGQ